VVNFSATGWVTSLQTGNVRDAPFEKYKMNRLTIREQLIAAGSLTPCEDPDLERFGRFRNVAGATATEPATKRRKGHSCEHCDSTANAPHATGSRWKPSALRVLSDRARKLQGGRSRPPLKRRANAEGRLSATRTQ
jgi:hypothetical protein